MKPWRYIKLEEKEQLKDLIINSNQHKLPTLNKAENENVSKRENKVEWCLGIAP